MTAREADRVFHPPPHTPQQTYPSPLRSLRQSRLACQCCLQYFGMCLNIANLSLSRNREKKCVRERDGEWENEIEKERGREKCLSSTKECKVQFKQTYQVRDLWPVHTLGKNSLENYEMSLGGREWRGGGWLYCPPPAFVASHRQTHLTAVCVGVCVCLCFIYSMYSFIIEIMLWAVCYLYPPQGKDNM